MKLMRWREREEKYIAAKQNNHNDKRKQKAKKKKEACYPKDNAEKDKKGRLLDM